jgi:hypothetical protein
MAHDSNRVHGETDEDELQCSNQWIVVSGSRPQPPQVRTTGLLLRERSLSAWAPLAPSSLSSLVSALDLLESIDQRIVRIACVRDRQDVEPS